MFPVAAAELLRDTHGQDAVHVAEVGLRAADDAQVAATARAEGRAVVTENVADFAAEREVVLVFVLKRNLPAGGGQAAATARILDRWAHDFPDPYLGHHWPKTDADQSAARDLHAAQTTNTYQEAAEERAPRSLRRPLRRLPVGLARQLRLGRDLDDLGPAR